MLTSLEFNHSRFYNIEKIIFKPDLKNKRYFPNQYKVITIIV